MKVASALEGLHMGSSSRLVHGWSFITSVAVSLPAPLSFGSNLGISFWASSDTLYIEAPSSLTILK